MCNSSDPAVCLPQPSVIMRFLPAVGYALLPAVGPFFPDVVALFFSFTITVNRPSDRYFLWTAVLVSAALPRRHLFQSPSTVCSFTYHVSRLYVLRCVRSPASLLASASVAPRAPNSHQLCNARPRLRQGLGCLDELLASTTLLSLPASVRGGTCFQSLVAQALRRNPALVRFRRGPESGRDRALYSASASGARFR